MATQNETHYPFEGQIFKSANKKFAEVVFFVHFYGGHKKALYRHIRMVNDLGFDAFAFHLEKPNKKIFFPINSSGQFGWKHLYAEQIEKLLNLLPERKIIFSFSNPSAAVAEALARRQASDVAGWICDSGPSGKLAISGLKLGLSYFQKQKYMRSVLTCTLLWTWSPYFHQDTLKHLSELPKNFPVLSIRGWKDALISPSDIDLLFEPQDNLNWTKLSLPEAGHLDGLKKCPKEYLAGVVQFIETLSLTRIQSQEKHR